MGRPGMALLSSFDALQENAHDLPVKGIFKYAIFVARIHIRVVVDLYHIELVADLLKVNSVKSVTDEICGSQRNRDQLLGSLVERNSLGSSLAQFVLLGVALDDLPVSRRKTIA